ncbi:MAG TPA: sigma-70 family RNA polymerase sigma factor [Candidatus Udaeobacter sp.]|nr:sigma-70 family RNA polymerase sigma factor [Candidatus Udaeobacter sp.]
MKNTVQASPEISGVVEHLFRHEGAKMVATLTRIFGIEHLSLAEDVVQEALVRALQTWPFYGVPKNPSAWIMRASRNLALDVVRRRKVFQNKQAEIIRLMDRDGATPDEAIFSEDEISDDRLRLIFVCCHPAIPAEAQVALALKTLCGFSVAEIGHAFLSTEVAIAKRLTRAKQKIHQARIPFEIPAGRELEQRLDRVLQSLYLLFNEGYKASSGENLVREELCEEAIRLTELLVAHPTGKQPKTHALLALMLLNAARNRTRLDSEGNLLRLQEQDRKRWDKSMIARGMFHFAQSAAGDELSEYHLQAGIAACHCAAKDYDSTDWQKILSLYDRLIEFNQSPVVALNRAVAVANIGGPKAGLQAVRSVRDLNKLSSYYLLYAVLGEFEMRSGKLQAAAEQFRKSFELAETKSERAFLLKRLQRCVDGQKN